MMINNQTTHLILRNLDDDDSESDLKVLFLGEIDVVRA